MKISVLLAGALALGLSTAPLRAQSTGPSHSGFDPNAPTGAHFHEGELGEKLMILESALKCDCGCGLDVHSCQFQMQCGTSPVWTLRIREELEAGQTVEAIQAGFVADFGPAVLMAPPPEGFNLVGYFLPAVAIAAAGLLIGLVAKGTGPRGAEAAFSGPVTTADETRLREALRKLDAEESPDW